MLAVPWGCWACCGAASGVGATDRRFASPTDRQLWVLGLGRLGVLVWVHDVLVWVHGDRDDAILKGVGMAGARDVAGITAVDGRFAAHVDRLQAHLSQLEATGRAVTVEELEDALALSLPVAAPSPWAERIGPVFTTGQLQELLAGVGTAPRTDEAVRDRRRKGRLIGFKTADGRWAWPAFQFRVAPGRLVPRRDVLELWHALAWEDAEPLGLISWLTGRRRDLDEATPLRWLDEHGLDQRLTDAAARLRGRLAA